MSTAGQDKGHAPYHGKLKLGELRPDHLQALYAAKSAAGLSPRTVRYIHSILHHALRQAELWSLVPRNVSEAARPPRQKRKALRTLDPGEVRQLLEAIKDEPLYPLYLLALTTGMRQGEILGLHWAEVDLESEPSAWSARCSGRKVTAWS